MTIALADVANLSQLLRQRATQADGKGFRFLGDRGDSYLSFTALDAHARALAVELADRGLAGERILLCYPPGVEFLIGLFGVLHAGGVAVPAYPPRAHRADVRLEGIIADCAAAAVLTTSAIQRDFERLTATLPRLRGLPYISSTADLAPNLAAQWQPPRSAPLAPAILQYTSGSTGTPRGVMLSHACVLHNLNSMRRLLGLNATTDGVSWLPAFHDMGLIGNLLQAVLAGASLTLLAPAAFVQDPLRWLQAISHQRAYISGGPSFALRHCVNRLTPELCQGLDLSCWQVAYVGAEPVLAADLDHFCTAFAPFGFRREALLPTYGLAEATLMVSASTLGSAPVVRSFEAAALDHNRAEPADAGRRLVSCGPVVPDMEVRITDPATNLPLPEGCIGEIWVAGPSIALGYWNRPEESAQTFAAHCSERNDRQFLRTGDLGFLLDGQLFVSGRLKDLIIVNGRNLYPQDIESAIDEACPELAAMPSAAFAVGDDAAPALVVAHEVPRGFSAVAGHADLFDRAGIAVANLFELPLQTLVLVRPGSLPRASSGKIRRGECRRLYQNQELEALAVLAPSAAKPREAPPASMEVLRDWLTQWLARQLSLPTERIDTDRPFAAYGLDSVAMLTMAADLQKWLGRPLSPVELYNAPTVTAMARYLAEAVGAERPAVPAAAAGPAPIAVIGVGCRFPQCDGPAEFWQALRAGVCLVGDAPAGRWADVPAAIPTTRGAYLADVDCFDAALFGIAPREAIFMDPQHRILLETAWAALEHAGIAPHSLANSATGAFIGISTSDYSRLLLNHTGAGDAYLATGNAASMAAHRLSYHFDWRGPSLAVDTACSSSLVALHLACQSLRAGECELAVASGVSLMLSLELTESLALAGMLSPTARCSAFAATADGYVRGEGCGVVVLKPLAAARRAGDPILAVIEASAINQDGRSNGITAPNGLAQADLIRRTLAQAQRGPADVTYVEAHGTGTPLGDPIEFAALQTALGNADRRCALASVKTNLGHLEAAAGIAGFIKTVLQIHHGEIVPHLHGGSVNPHINLSASRFDIPQSVRSWGGAGQPRVAGVSAFGFGGTNAHILVAQAEPPSVSGGPEPRLPHLLPLSARSDHALRALARRYAVRLQHLDARDLRDLCASASRGRNHLPHRLAVTGDTPAALAEALTSWAAQQPTPGVMAGSAQHDLTGRVAFLFTGQGAQAAGMGRALYEHSRVFRDELDRCDARLRRHGLPSIHDVLAQDTLLDETEFAQPALFALEYALAQVWRHWGIEPAALLGHSVGELPAAALAGVLTVDEAARLAVARGRLMQACPEGAMLACFASLAVVKETLQPWPDELGVAAVNGPESIVLAGPPGAVTAAQEALAIQNVPTRRLRGGRAFHSAAMEAALPGLRALSAGIVQHSPTIPLVSNVTGHFLTTAPAPDYWAEHARATVQFAAGVRTLHAAGITHFLEIGPDAVLARLGADCVPAAQTAWLTSLSRRHNDSAEMLGTLANLYVAGASVNWDHFTEGAARRHLDLPTYPFERQRWWFDAAPRKSSTTTGAPIAPSPWHPVSHWGQRLPRTTTGFDQVSPALPLVVADVKARHAVQDLAAIRGEFDTLAGLYVAEACAELGWQPIPGETATTERLADQLGVQPTQRRLLARLLTMAADDGWLQAVAGGWQVVREPTVADTGIAWQALLGKFPAFTIELQLAQRCAHYLPAVLRATEDPLHVLFGDDGARLTAELYEKSPVASFYNEILARVLAQLVSSLAARRPVRILELGAGTGGTTAHVLPLLPAGQVEYVFSDVSQLFLVQARPRFQRFPFVQYQTLDLEQEPEAQGFAAGQFDVVIAANVFHATADLRRCVRAARQLLAPAGALLLLEGTGPRRLLDLIFGLAPGWWKFADHDLRPDYPLVAPACWQKLLGEEGFSDVTIMPAPGPDLADPDQVVIVAIAGAAAAPSRNSGNRAISGVARGRQEWALVGAAKELANAVAAHLQSLGDEVTILAAGAASTGREDCHWVDFTGSKRPTVGGSSWRVSCGQASLDGTHPWPPADLEELGDRLIDLDPLQPVAVQAACLVEALLHPDEHRAVIYRGDQRYIRRRAASQVAEPAQAPAGDRARADLEAAPPAERRALLVTQLRRDFASVVGLELAAEDLDRPLQTMGLDSLMGLQFRNRVEASLGISLSIVDVLRGLSLNQIIDKTLAKLGTDAPQPPPPAAQQMPDHLTPDAVEHLSEHELNHLLQTLLR